MFPTLFDAFHSAGKSLYLVGGAVRDILLHRLGLPHGKPLEQLDDLDFCTNALPDETLEILKSAGYSTYEIGKQFGTIGSTLYASDAAEVRSDHAIDPTYFPKDIQITTFRSKESYKKGSRHPTVSFGTTIDQDLWRRDFSINSMALDGNGDLVDPYDGQTDLIEKRIRVVNDPLETLAEDPLRILRTARFAARLNFQIDPMLEAAATQRASELQEISHERWLQEINKLLVSESAVVGLNFLKRTKALQEILPEIAALPESSWNLICQFITRLNKHRDLFTATTNAPDILWSALLIETPTITDTIAHRFRMSRLSRTTLAAITGSAPLWEKLLSPQSLHLDDSLISEHLRRATYLLHGQTRASLIFWSTWYEMQQGDHAILQRYEELERRREILHNQGELYPTLPEGIGSAIISQLKIPPGPTVGLLKDQLIEAIITGNLENNASAKKCITFLRETRDK